MQQGIELPATVPALLGQLACCFGFAVALIEQLLQGGSELGFVPGAAGWCSAAPQHQGAFTLGRYTPKVLQGGGHRWPHLLLMPFGELACHLQGSIAQYRQEVFKQLQQPVWCLVQDHGARFLAQLGQASAALAGFGRQKPFEAEATAGQAAAHQCGGHGTGPGHTDHRQASLPGRGHQRFARIRDAWQTGVAHHGDCFTGREGLEQFGDALELVVLVKAHQPLTRFTVAQAELMQQQAAAARVLAGDAVGSRQHLPGPGGEIPQVADRRAHQIQHSGGGFNLLHNAPRLGLLPACVSMMPAAPVVPVGISSDQLLAVLRPLCWGAADILLAYGRGEQPPHGFSPALSVEDGGDGPVSAADLAVNHWLLEGLGAAFPAAPWTLLSEETAKQQLQPGVPLPAEWLWILDPLDGTKDFLQGTGEYAVHLALVCGGRPTFGAVLLPALEELWFGLLPGGEAGPAAEAWCEDRAGRRTLPRLSPRRALGELLLVASRNHRDQRLEDLLAALQLGGSLSIGSVGGKVATILRGESDLYLSLSGRSAPKDWDMAAPEAVLRAAGGSFSHADGRPLLYNTGDVQQSGCLIASHGPSHGELCGQVAAQLASLDPGFRV